MELIQFCRDYGILIDHTPPLGVWRRYATDDHPRSKNGAVKYMGDYAHVQNHATMTEPITWQIGKEQRAELDLPALRERLKKAENERTDMQARAAKKAAWIVGQCKNQTHQYLIAKGFKDTENASLLVVPMRHNENLCGVQLIDENGVKKFLSGAKTGYASHVIDNKGTDYVCEGYATGLSIRRALGAFKLRYRVHVCFSAGNALKIAKALPNSVFIADNDASGTGERAAKESGRTWWMPPVVGNDANDYEQLHGTFALGLILKQLALQKIKAAV
jgi:phage/plasmid primase-like uncharacterized protein